MPDICCICQNPICITNIYTCNKCSNKIHKSCLAEWLENGDGCPMCRNDIKISDIYKPTICCICTSVLTLILLILGASTFIYFGIFK